MFFELFIIFFTPRNFSKHSQIQRGVSYIFYQFLNCIFSDPRFTSRTIAWSPWKACWRPRCFPTRFELSWRRNLRTPGENVFARLRTCQHWSKLREFESSMKDRSCTKLLEVSWSRIEELAGEGKHERRHGRIWPAWHLRSVRSAPHRFKFLRVLLARGNQLRKTQCQNFAVSSPLQTSEATRKTLFQEFTSKIGNGTQIISLHT